MRENSCICKVNLLICGSFSGILSFVKLYFPLSYLEVTFADISYKKLWKLLIDKDMKKKDLQVSAGISWASVTKLSKGEPVSMDVLIKVCKALDCNIGDIVDFIPEDR